MASYYWLKVYIEILDDPKTARLPDNLWRRFIECCLLAKELNQKGRLPPTDEIAWRLRIDEDVLTYDLARLAQIGLLELIACNDGESEGYWFIINFAKRQRKMSNAERQKRYRDRRRRGNDTLPKGVREEEEEEEEEEEGPDNNIFRLYERDIGPIPGNEIVVDELKDAEETYPWKWIEDAFVVAVRRNARNWAYIRAVLEGWRADGKQDIRKPKQEKSYAEQLAEAGYK